MESAFEELIIQTEDESTAKEASDQLQEMLQNPDSIPALINLFSQNETNRIRTACLAFLHKIIETNWESFSDEGKIELKNFVLSLFSERIDPKYIKMICSMAGTIYSKDSDPWDELVSEILESWESHPFIASQLLVSIIDHFSWENYEESEDFEDFAQRFLDMDSFFITSSDKEIHIAGIQILSSIIGYITGYDELPNCIDITTQVAAKSPKYSPDDFTTIWNSISAIITTLEDTKNHKEEEDQEESSLVDALIQIAVQVASTRDIESTLRILPITTIVNEISSNKSDTDSSLMEKSLDLIIDVVAQSIEETDVLPFDLLSLVSTLFDAQLPRGEIYALISAKIFEALESESVSYQASGLLILRILLVDAPDCSHNDAPKIADIIMKAIQSEDPLLIQASASVVGVFDETFKSMNIFSVDLLNAILPYTVHDQVEVRQHCLEASLFISEILDTEIPDFFKNVWELYEKSDPDDLTLFFTLIANSIKYTPEFDDDDVSTVMKLLEKVFQEKNDLEVFASSLTIINALISFDSQLTEELLPKIQPGITECLEYENSNVLNMTVTFLSDCITFFKESGIEIVIPFVPQLSSFITNPTNEIVTDNVRSESLITLSHLVKHCFLSENEELDIESLIPELIEIINSFIDSNSDELEKGGSSSICSLAPVVDDEVRLSFMEKLINQVESHTNLSVIQESIRAIARLLKVSNGENAKMTDLSLTILTQIIEGNVSFLNGPLIEVDTVVSLFENICKLITALISVKCQMTDEICDFLLQFIQRESELDKIAAIGALSDAIWYESASPEICESIIQSVVELIQGANDPGLQENIIHLFNVCVIKQPQLIQSIMEIIDGFINWWKNAVENQSGYSRVIDNLSSLFLSLAISYDNFPQDLLVQVFESFPRLENDSSTTANMCRNLITFIDIRKDSIEADLLKQIALAVARVFMLDKFRLSEMEIDNELQKQLQSILIELLKMIPELMNELEQMCENSKVKARRLESIISNV